MIKRIQLVRKRRSLSARDFEAGWTQALTRDLAGAVRATVCIPLDPDPLHDGISIAWFTALARPQLSAAELLEPGEVQELFVDEVVLRGAEWLEQRWRSPEPKFKHMALARRAAGLTAAEFSQRWRNRPGRVGTVTIPDAAKGQAYCQNHPLPDCQSPAYDAINEVYFDRLEDMQARIAFFRDNSAAQLDADLVQEPRFLIVREHLISCS